MTSKTGHYSIGKIESIDDLRSLFPPEVDYTLNWLFLGTSGVHGCYTSLDDLENEAQEAELWADGEAEITVLVVHPRMVRTQYGHIAIGPQHIPWLREVAGKTMLGVMQSQRRNL